MQNYEIIRVKYMRKSLGFGGRELQTWHQRHNPWKKKLKIGPYQN